MRTRFRAWRNKTTIHMQLSIVVGLVVALLILCLVSYSYIAQRQANVRHQTEFLTRLLDVESEQLDGYIAELSGYSLQLRNDSAFMELIAQDTPANYTQRQALEGTFKTFFYARSDIQEMDLYLLRQDLRYHVDSSNRKVRSLPYTSPDALEDYPDFIAAPNYISIRPDESGFLTITRTIIDSPRTTPLAVVRFLVDATQIDALLASHQSQSEQAFLFDASGTALSRGGSAQEVWDALQARQTQVRLDGTPHLLVASEGNQNGLVLAVAKPMPVVNASLIRTRNISLLLGIAALALTVTLVLCAIRMLTKPLASLARNLQSAGSGDFQKKTDLQGSYEMIGLSTEVNRMMADIAELIDRTYVATLNERTAQLIALEAQTNPHFLFNTLQAIATEAIVANNERLYQMTTALASLLRYSIKGGNLATLDVELQHVEKYIYLQRARFSNRINCDVNVDGELLSFHIPKLGLLTLVENSIVHGMSGAVESIHLSIECSVREGGIRLCVQDDGAGIDAERLDELRRMLDENPVILTQNIGLGNLSSRLQLLYHGKAQMQIHSSQSDPRGTRIELLIPLEELLHA